MNRLDVDAIYCALLDQVEAKMPIGQMVRTEINFVRDALEIMWELLGGDDPHKMTVVNGGWTIAHPLPCRLQPGGLLACTVSGFTEDLIEGVYVLREDGAWVREDG